MSILVFNQYETIGFDVKTSIARPPVLCLIKPGGINKRILRKGYLVLWDFSWIENFKLIYALYIIISNKISEVHSFFFLAIHIRLNQG